MRQLIKAESDGQPVVSRHLPDAFNRLAADAQRDLPVMLRLKAQAVKPLQIGLAQEDRVQALPARCACHVFHARNIRCDV